MSSAQRELEQARVQQLTERQTLTGACALFAGRWQCGCNVDMTHLFASLGCLTAPAAHEETMAELQEQLRCSDSHRIMVQRAAEVRSSGWWEGDGHTCTADGGVRRRRGWTRCCFRRCLRSRRSRRRNWLRPQKNGAGSCEVWFQKWRRQ